MRKMIAPRETHLEAACRGTAAIFLRIAALRRDLLRRLREWPDIRNSAQSSSADCHSLERRICRGCPGHELPATLLVLEGFMEVQMSRFTLPILLVLVLGCAQAQVAESNARWADGRIVPFNMCSRSRSIDHSNDPEGQRAYCSLEELIGSHIPKCVCRDESKAAYERANAQQYMRDAEQSRQLVHGG